MSKISNLEYYLPESTLNNNQLEKEFPEWNSEKIADKIGIERRHIVEKDQTALDLGFKAAEKLFRTYDKNGIDFVLLCTQSPDFFLPTSACILQDKLKLGENIG